MESESLNDLRNAYSLTLQKEPTENCWYIQLSWLMIPPSCPLPLHMSAAWIIAFQDS